MSDFLSRLAGRSMGVEPVVQPVIPAMTSPASPQADLVEQEAFGEAAEPFVMPVPAPLDAPNPTRRPESPRGEAAGSPRMQAERAVERSGESWARTLPWESAASPAPKHSKGPPENPDFASLTLPRADHTMPDPASPMPSASRARPAPDRRETAAAPAPIVRVTIGRIEVRAELSAPKVRSTAPPRTKPAGVSLDDYLKQRVEGRR